MKKLRLALSSASSTVKVLGLVMLFASAYAGVNFYQKYSFQPQTYSSAMMMDDTPIVGIPCYVNGDQTGSSTEAFIAVLYDAEMGANSLGGNTDITPLASAGDIGPTWGVAYNQETNDFYASTVLKRHIGQLDGSTASGGKMGSIFRIAADLMGGAPSELINLAGATYTGGTVDVGADPHTYPLGGTTTPTTDPMAFDAAGKRALGDLDISIDRNTLYTMNLFNDGGGAELVEIDITNPSSPSVTTTYPITSSTTGITCINGELRPWGIGVDKISGAVYIGVVCSGENGGSTADLVGFILELTGNTFSQVFSFPLNYDRGLTGVGTAESDWVVWSDVYAPAYDQYYDVNPQPLIGDIEILSNGNFLVSLLDRWGLQTGTNTLRPDGTGSGNVFGAAAERGRAAGDVLLFSSTGTQIADYGDDMSCLENAASLGGIAIEYGATEFIGVNVDPVQANSNGLGVVALPGSTFPSVCPPGGNSSPTLIDNQNILFGTNGNDPNTADKGLGLGDVEIGILNPTCLISDAGLQNVQCGGSNEITFSLNPSTTGGGSGYSVSVSSGSISPASASYSTDQQFTLGENSAGAGNILLTITDNDNASCQLSLVIVDPGECMTGPMFDIHDPCTCFDVEYDSPETDAYEFLDSLLVISDQTGETWTIIAQTGMEVIDSFANSGPIPIGTQLIEKSPMMYSLRFAHTTDIGYSVTVENENGVQLSIGNVCSKSEITVSDLTMPPYCPEATTPTLDLASTASSTNPGTFTFDVIRAEGDTLFNQSQINPGDYEDGDIIEVRGRFVPDDLAMDCPHTFFYEIDFQQTECPVTCDPGNLGGTVLNDINFNGIQDIGEEGLAGVKVYIYECDNDEPVDSTVSNFAGQWSIAGLSNYPYRVEFVSDDPNFLPANIGTANGTETQFVDAASCDVNFGMFIPANNCGDDPFVLVTCFIQGDNNGDVVVAFPLSNTADIDGNVGGSYNGGNPKSAAGYPSPQIIAMNDEVGTTYGVAYERNSQTLFLGSYLRRKTKFGGLSSESTGAIYAITDPIGGGAPEVYADLNDIFGAGTAGANPHPASSTNFLDDNASVPFIGKASLGDVEISLDGEELYVVNMADKKLYVLPTDGPLTAADAGSITSFDIPTAIPGCAPEDIRPMGLGVNPNTGVLYVGAVCSAESTMNAGDLRALVWTFDGGTFDLVFEAPLDYPRGNAPWEPWSNIDDDASGDHPEPMLADIEFDGEDLIIGLRDRYGDKTPAAFMTGSEAPFPRLHGDVLRVCNVNGTLVLENNAECGGTQTAGASRNFGPGGGEYYFGDDYSSDGNDFPDGATGETANGGLLLLPGSGQVLTTAFDPTAFSSAGTDVDDGFNVGGISVYDNTTGDLVGAYAVYDATTANTFAKVGGLGDLEAACEPNPIQIGNFAWIDADGDGVQDACEEPLSNLTVKLYLKSAPNDTVLVATTITDINGNYYFTDNTNSDEIWEAGFSEILQDTTYLVVFCGDTPNAEGNTEANGLTYNLTSSKTGEGLDPNNNDSDPALEEINGNTVPTFCFVTDEKKSDYRIDAGFLPEPVSIGDTVFVDLNYNGLQDNEPGIEGVTVTLFNANDGSEVTMDIDGNTIMPQLTDVTGRYKFENLPAGSYYVEFDVTSNTAGIAYAPTLENANGGSLDATDSDVDEFGRSDTTSLVLGQMDCTLDAGYIVPGKIGDTVFVDNVFTDGLQTPLEPGIGGVIVTLLDGSGVPVTQGAFGAINPMTTTDANGMYMFGDLLPGDYMVKFDIGTLGGNYVYTFGNEGGNDAIDSDVPQGMGMAGMATTATITVGSGDTINTVDAGVVECMLAITLVPTMDACILPGGVPNPIVATPTGGVAPYTFNWSTTETTAMIAPTPTETTTYSVTVTDALGCVAVESITLISCSSIGNKVFFDSNQDGQQDPDEPGVPGIVTYLLDKDMNRIPDPMNPGIDWSVTTDADGMYIYDDILIDLIDPTGDTFFVEFVIDETQGTLLSPVQDPDVNSGMVTDTDTDSDVDDTPFGDGFKSGEIVLLPNSALVNVDAGIIGNDTIGDFVWNDLDGNGIQDDGEPGIDGVNVFLKINGVVVDQTITDASGRYLFDDLIPNASLEYSVQFESPMGFYPTVLDEGGDDMLDSDADPSMMLMSTSAITFTMPDQIDTSFDAGFFAPVSVGDTVFVDINGNGLQDVGEPGIENVTVSLFKVDDLGNATAVTNDLDGNPLATTTDAAGRYKFENLAPGNYFVNFDASTAAGGANLVATLENVNGGSGDPSDSDVDSVTGDSDTITVTSGNMDCTLDAGYFLPVSIGDTVFVDANFNGIQDDGEPGLAGVTVSLFDTSGTQITTDLDGMALPTTTDADGRYKFENLAPNQYYVVFDVSTSSDPMAASFVPTTQNMMMNGVDEDDSDINVDEVSDTIEVASGGIDCTLDAGYFAPVAVGDTVFVDVNGNGLQDDGEPGIPGVTVTLFDDGGNQVTTLFDGSPLGSIVSDANGLYKIDSLLPGAYYVVFDVSTATDGNAASYVPTFENANTNQLDPDDSDIDDTGISDLTAFLNSGEMDCTLDAGYFVPASIGDTAFVDANGNGVFEDGEDILANVQVELIKIENGIPVVQTTDYLGNDLPTTTDADGRYKFENLAPGEYQVIFTSPAGTDYVITLSNVGTDELSDSDAIIDDATLRTTGTSISTIIESGGMDCTIDAGFYEPVSLGDTVFVDSNGNGIQDDMEVLAFVPVALFDTSGTQITQDIFGNDLPLTTDANGRYKFENLAPNQYYVQFDVASTVGLADAGSYLPTIQNVFANVDDQSDSDINTMEVSDIVELATDSIDCSVDAGYFIPVAVGDTVFVDNNGNGVQDIGEPGVANVSVTLYRVNDMGVGVIQTVDYLNNPIDMVETDAAGRYKFENLLPGRYYVEFDLNNAANGTNYYSTYENINVLQNDPGDSDVDSIAQVNLFSDTSIVLTSGEMDCTLDAGVFEPIAIGDTVFVDANLNGLQDAGEPGLSGVVATLFYNSPLDGWIEVTQDIDGAPVTPMISDATGRYKFENLPPGEYYVNFDSGGIPPTLQDAGTDDAIDSDIDNAGNSDTLVVLSTDVMNCTFDAGYQGLDYGDLPDSYVTADSTNAADAPKHVMREGKFLGSLVDQDVDGGPSADGSADDATGSPYVIPAGASGDDEDGIEFISPMLPGNIAYVKITYTTNSDAFLNGWVDFDGSGNFSATDALNWVEVDGAVVAPGTNLSLAIGTDTMIIAAFEVPEGATFANGNAFARFRMSCDGNLAPDSGLALDGEIEDYVTPLAKIGNYVWLDANFDGIQDPVNTDEVALEGVQIVLSYDTVANGQSISIIDTVETDANGLYSFCGLVASEGAKYQLTLITPDGLASTMMNIGDDQFDNDADILVGEEGRDSIQTLPFMIMDATDQPIGESGEGDDPNVVGTFPDNQVNQTYDFGLVPLDFGDLPEMDFGDLPISYQTSEDGSLDPPRHIVTTNKRLGACVDSEPDGQPDEMGMGDDDNIDDTDEEFAFGDCSAGDDEDGIEFLTPMIPGDSAYLKLTYTLPAPAVAGEPAGFVTGFIDFNGDGVFNAIDRIRIFSINGIDTPADFGTIPLGEGADSMVVVGFLVPEEATFNGGHAFTRFRLACERGLSAVGVLPDGSIPEGEVEDYVLPLVKVGNLVWLDQNYDGIQDTSDVSLEEGIEGVEVSLTYNYVDTDNDIDIQITVDSLTDENGNYAFCGLLPNAVGTYKITVQSPEFLTPTLANNPTVSDSLDSDHSMNMGDSIVMTEIFQIPDVTNIPSGEDGLEDAPNTGGTFPDSLFNQTFDFGFVPLDYGDLDSTYVTAIEDGGPVHVISENKYLGQGADAERTAAVDSIAGALGDGDDNAPGLTVPSDATITDDEDGIQFLTPLIPGTKATISVNYTLTEEDGFLNGWIDFNGNGTLDPEEALSFYTETTAEDTDGALASAIDTTVELCFNVPEDAVYSEGNVHARFRLSCEGGLLPVGGFPVPDPEGPQAPQGEVEDYFVPLAKIGNLAFFDNNLNGSQDADTDVIDENGVEGVNHILAYAGPDGIFDPSDFIYNFTTDENGNYFVCGLIEGQYNIVPTKYDTSAVTPEDSIPPRYILTVANCDEDDNLDSDFMPNLMFAIPNLLTTDLVTGEGGDTDEPGTLGFPDEQDQLNFDEGWIPEPNIEAIANIAGVDYPESGQCGNFNVIADVCIQNTGFVEMDGERIGARLDSIDIEIDLGAQFMGAFVGVIGDPVILDTVEYEDAFMLIDDDDRPTENPDFDGNDDIDGSLEDGIVEPGEIVCLRIEFEIRPEALPEEEAMNLAFNAVVSAGAINADGKDLPDYFNNGAQYMAVDSSDRMFAFDGTFDDPDEPEPLGNCYETSLPLSQQPINLSYDENCMALVTPAMVLTELDEECTNDVYPLGGYYRLQLEDLQGNVLIPFTDSLKLTDPAYVGNMYNVVAQSVADVCNSSWAKITVENKFDPVIECVSDTITCGELIVLDPPSVLNNCGEINLRLIDRQTMDVACEDPELQVVIIETWEVTDVLGVRMSSCTQTLSVEKFDITAVEGPATTDTTLNCAVGIMPSPEELGVPTLNGVDLYPDNFVDCGIYVDFEDEFFDFGNNCASGVKRTWTVQNWICGTDNIATFAQLITFVDTTGPVLSDVPADMTISTSGQECEASLTIPAVTFADECNPENIRVDISYDGGFISNQNGATINLPSGTNEVRYVVYDVCGNTSIASFNVTVQDLEQPVTICDAFTTVSLNSEGKASLTAVSLDNGSMDQCGPVTLEIMRMEDTLPFREAVDFTCEDIGDENIMVILRVTDESGNSNQCMAEVALQDKIPPVLVEGLPDITVSCTFPFSMDNLSVFGTVVNVADSVKPIVIDDEFVQFSGPARDALILDNCSTAEMSEITGGDLDQCGKGTLIRTITATSPNGESISFDQRITLVNPSPFSEEDITWPDDITITGDMDDANPFNLPEGFNFPQYVEGNCDMVSSTFEDQIIQDESDTCKTVIRRSWFVSDWCQRINGVFILFEETQLITVNREDTPEITSTCDDVTVMADEMDCTGAFVPLIVEAEVECSATGLSYRYDLDFNDNGSIDASGTSADASGFYPPGTHRVTFTVFSGGSSTSCSYLFTVTITDPTIVITSGCEDVTVNSDDCDEAFVPLVVSAEAGCATEDLTYSYSIDFNNDGSSDVTGMGADASDNYPGGTHSITFTIDNGISTEMCTYLFTVNVSDGAVAITSTCEDVTVNAAQDNCDGEFVELIVEATGGCEGEELTYSYQLDFNDDGSIDASGDGNDASDTYPAGTHRVYFVVTAENGQSAACDYLFTVINNDVVEAICQPTQTVILELVDTDDDGENDNEKIVIAPSLIDNGSNNSCNLDVTISFSADITDQMRMYDCDDVGQQALMLFVTDSNGKKDSCITSIVISDDNGEDLCNPVVEICNCDSPNDYAGMVVVTCNVDFDSGGDRFDAVGAIYDTRNNSAAPLGADWGTTAPVAQQIPTPNWTYDEIGPIFGIATDASANVYLGQTDVYNITETFTGTADVSYEAGWIYRASPPSFTAQQFVRLPNTGGRLNGIGNLAFDNVRNQLFATNLEDGKIYRISGGGLILETYDPFAADDGANGIVSLPEQIWGVQVVTTEDGITKVYFPRITDTTREIYSLQLVNGAFPVPGSEVLEISDIPGILPRITDIAFSQDGTKMLLSERGTNRSEQLQGPVDVEIENPGALLTAHLARVLNYEFIDGNWVEIVKENGDQKFYVGGNLRDDGNNSAGGVTFGYLDDGTDPFICDSIIWASGNYLNATISNISERAYGIQGIMYGGNESVATPGGSLVTDLYVDFDGLLGPADEKGVIGDVEIFNCGRADDEGQLVDIRGSIYTEEMAMISDVEVKLSDTDIFDYTDEDGLYLMDRMPMGGNYSIRPFENRDHLNGVSTLDLLLIQRHILGITPITSPLKLIAADINKDGKVTSIDLLQLRKLILGLTDEFPDNTSWRFVYSDYEFLDPQNPWSQSIPEEYDIYDLSSDMEIDFFGLKVGDVNGNVEVNGKPVIVERRAYNEPLHMSYDERGMKPGEILSVPVYADNIEDFAGFQFSMKVDPSMAQLQGVKTYQSAINGSHFGLNKLRKGVFTASWNEITDTDIDAGEPIFVLEFKALKSGLLSEALSLNSDVTEVEAYDKEGMVLDVELGMREELVTYEQPELYQNEPNPWTSNTVISFKLPKQVNATIRIFDLAGKLIKEHQQVYGAGVHEYELTEQEFAARGIYYYELITDGYKLSKKMVLIK